MIINQYNQIAHPTEPPHYKSSKMTLRPAKTQISLGIHPVWSESSLCAQWVAKDPSFLHVDSEDSDQTRRMPRLIRVFAGHTRLRLSLSKRAVDHSSIWGNANKIPPLKREVLLPTFFRCGYLSVLVSYNMRQQRALGSQSSRMEEPRSDIQIP